ncbi:MAG: glycoside hydrolase, partial [Phycisphaeraceae bacterium JB051]
MQVIAPGIWQWTIGQPEEHTPTHHRAFEPCLDTMATLPGVEQCPFDPANFKTKQTKRGLQIEIPLTESDELYGLGLQLKSHRQTGKMKKLAVNSDPVADTGDSHAPVPVIMSTNGWGIFVNSLRYVTFQCASNQKVSANAKAASAENDIAINTEDLYAQKQLSEKLLVIEVPHVEGVEVMFISGPDMVTAVKRYNLYSGGGCLPSLWGLGVWYRAFGRFNQEEVMDMAKHLRERNMPCDVLGLE